MMSNTTKILPLHWKKLKYLACYVGFLIVFVYAVFKRNYQLNKYMLYAVKFVATDDTQC